MKSKNLLRAVVVLTAVIGFQCKQAATVPDSLVGVWETAAPRYADRFFEIKKNHIIFGTGEGNFDVQRIKSIEETGGAKSTAYTIHYANPGEPEHELSFYYEPDGNGIVRFKNQHQIKWTKRMD